MKKYLSWLLLLFCIPAAVSAQFGLPSGFDFKAFTSQEELALWLIQYDTAQYRIQQFDATTQRETQICLPLKDDAWKVYSGKIDSTGMLNVRMFTINSKGKIELSKKVNDTGSVNAMARALFDAQKEVRNINLFSSSRDFVRVNTDNSITVWCFPENVDKQNISYGPELIFWYSEDGKTMITTKHKSYTLQKAEIEAGVLLFQIPNDKMPMISLIYLAHRFCTTYPELKIAYKTGISTFYYRIAEHTSSWQHQAAPK
jgi:hypothetical protein